MLYGSTPWSGENAFNLLQNIKTLVHILAVNRRLG
jgi:hypothetical protein